MTTNFRLLVDVCKRILQNGTRSSPSTERGYYAHCLFTKSVLHARSVVSLCDASSENEERLDVGAICVLVRCLIEVRNATSYLLEHNIKKDEALLRLRLIGLNQATDLARVNKGLGTSPNDFYSTTTINFLKDDLQRNPIFCSLDAEHQRNLLRGKSPYQHSRYKGARPIAVQHESAIYTLLSHSAHAFGLGLQGFAGYGSATPAAPANIFRIATSTAQIYLADTARTYCRFRNKAVGRLPEADRSAIDESVDQTQLMVLLREIRAGTP